MQMLLDSKDFVAKLFDTSFADARQRFMSLLFAVASRVAVADEAATDISFHSGRVWGRENSQSL